MFYKTNNRGFILLHQQEYQDYENISKLG